MKRKRDWLLWFGAAFLVLLVVVAIFGPGMGGGYKTMSSERFLAPSAEHWLGTDEQGRDIFARIAFGARISLIVGISVQFLALLIGITVGSLGVYAPKWIGGPLLRFTDGMFAFPDILLGILLVGLWRSTPASTQQALDKLPIELAAGLPIIIALASTAWPAIARLVMTQVSSLKDREFVVASKAIGGSTYYVVTRHVLPQLWGILMAVVMVDMAGTILAESTLSFLGIGVQPPESSWGSMINSARAYLNSHPMLLFWPCLFLSTTIFALNFVGDGIRAILDPKRGH